MDNQKGMTLIELVIVVSLAAVTLLATATYALPWIAREKARSAVYDVQSYLQLTRIEAVSRNRQCRFELNTATRSLKVFDGNGTPANKGDDVLLYETTLPSRIQFARPDAGNAVTLSQVGSSDVYETVFTADGIVTQGTGEVSLYGGDEYNRVMVFGAGGVSVDRWAGAGWVDDATTGAGSSQSQTQSGSLPPETTITEDLPPVDDGLGGTTDDGYTYQTY
jgi:prepilin-type N-terminal cleavage/methylation domain-containing protein